MRWTIVEDGAFRDELAVLIPSPQSADAFLESCIDYLSTLANAENQIPATDLYYKTIPDPANERFLVIFYHITSDEVVLRSIKTFSATDDFEM